MESLEKIVTDLYDFRDYYFENHPIEEAISFSSNLKNELNKTVEALQSEEDDALEKNRSFYFYLLGKTYNVENDYSAKAEELLSKAVKLNPYLIDAWNCLGEVYFKKGCIEEAKNCFLNALNKEKNKVSLRNLSVVLRKEIAKTKEEVETNVNTGLKYAQDALTLDPNDGTSWYIMGNAFIASFFSIKQSYKVLAQAMDAYERAENDRVAKSNPDLFYNKAVALKFQEKYEKALQYFNKVLQYDPHWKEVENIQENLLRYLSDIQDSINTKGRVKNRKLHNLISSINQEKHLGHFGKLSDPKIEGDVQLSYVQLNDLKNGINNTCVVLGVVVCSIQNEDLLPFAFCIVDSSNTCIAVTVYNLAKGQGVIIGDVAAIAMPYVNEVDFSFKDKKFNFTSIRVSNPLLLAVNGKPLPSTKLSTMQISTFSQADTKQ